MKAMLLSAPHEPLTLTGVEVGEPSPEQVLIRIEACAVCRTDLHLLDGELPNIAYPVIPGHQVVGTVVATARNGVAIGTRVGVPWLGYTCGRCAYCRSARENLCDEAKFTGYTLDGGYAEYLKADARYCFVLDPLANASAVAPLLCAGMIGFRALRLCSDAARIGLFGFGAAAHIVAQILRHQRREFFAFTRPGDRSAQSTAESLGAAWAGSSIESPPQTLDAAIIFAPVGDLVPVSLRHVAKGGTVVCAGIHMSDIPRFPYSLLWGERKLMSVANLTRADGVDFLKLAAQIPIQTEVHTYSLEDANQALEDLRRGAFTGSAVLEIADPT